MFPTYSFRPSLHLTNIIKLLNYTPVYSNGKFLLLRFRDSPLYVKMRIQKNKSIKKEINKLYENVGKSSKAGINL